MKAAVRHEVNKPLAIEDVSVPNPGPREVLIRTRVAGLCHSDLHFMEGGTATIVGMIPFGQKIELHGFDFLRERKIQGSSMGSNHFRVDMRVSSSSTCVASCIWKTGFQPS